MQVNIKSFIEQAGLNEPLYPGKRVVKPCPQPGEFRSHCIVYDWHDHARIRIEIKAGLSGRDLAPKDLARYPISFQAPTFMEIDVATGTLKEMHHANDDAEDEEGSEGRSGKSGSGGKAMKKKSLSGSLLSFASAAGGAIPEVGKLVNMVVLGMQIASEAYGQVVDKFFDQVQHSKVIATDLMAAAGKLLTRYTPPAFMEPKGNEDKVYKYNREKTEMMFNAGMMPG